MPEICGGIALWGRKAIMQALGGCSREEFALLVMLGMPVAKRRGGKYVAHKAMLDQWLMTTIDHAHRSGQPLEFLKAEGGYAGKEGGGSGED
jgi:hypothetical protein